MRTIKFRGRTSKGEWVYGYFSKNPNDDAFIFAERGDFLVEENTVGQFTGLLDCNGKEIYEGDIVRVLDPDYEHLGIGIAEYLNDYGIWYVDGEGTNDGLFDLYHQGCSFEVIGNIHDNPELFKKEE